MSDVSQGPGWWQASDGKWYPPKESEQPPAPGWWLAADGKWYPPVETEQPPRPGWWLAADGKWYPPVESTPPAAVSPPVFEPTPIEIDQLPPAPEPPAPPEPEPEPVPEPEPEATPEPVLEAPPIDAPVTPAAKAPAAPSARPPRSIEQASSRAAADNPRPTNPADQIRRRDAASRQDAIAQAPAVFLAASRALKLLDDLDDEPAPPPAPSPPTSATRSAAPPAAPKVEPKGTAAARSAARAAQVDAGPAPAGPRASAPTPAPPPAAPPAPPTINGAHPLIELRTSPLGAEIDHLGDRLLVFTDRVELRDRNDRVRQSLAGADITDVVIQRKFTGAVLTVESTGGETIITRGIKPEQADEARILIHQHTRQGRPPAPGPTAELSPLPSSPDDPAATSSDAVAAAAARLAILNRDRLNEADLLRKLADLHRAGVLTDAEFENKITLVGRLVSGESLAIS